MPKLRSPRPAPLLCTLLLSAVGQAHAQDCALPNEYRALSARVLQTRMMVAALACDAKRDYNGVVIGLRPALIEQGLTLRRYFQRSFGGGADRQLDRFTTRLANEESKRSTADRAAYCAAGKQLMARLNAVSTRQFADILDDTDLGAVHRVGMCSHEVLKKGAVVETRLATTRSATTPAVGSAAPRVPAADATDAALASPSSPLSAR